MANNRVKLWAGLGAAAFAAGAGSPAAAASDTTPATSGDTPAAVQLANGGGEGGEGGEGGTALPDAQKNLYRVLFLESHLRIGRQLIDAGAVDQGAVHVGHVVEHLDGHIGEELRGHGIDTDAVHDAAEEALDRIEDDADGAALHEGLNRVQHTIDALKLGVPARAQHHPDQVMSVATALLRKAGAEYDAAIENGEVVNLAEYQDARGFVWTARDLIGSAGAALHARNAGAYADLLDGFATLMDAFPSPTGPAASPTEPGAVSAAISRIELRMSALYTDGRPVAEGGEGGEGGEGSH